MYFLCLKNRFRVSSQIHYRTHPCKIQRIVQSQLSHIKNSWELNMATAAAFSSSSSSSALLFKSSDYYLCKSIKSTELFPLRWTRSVLGATPLRIKQLRQKHEKVSSSALSVVCKAVSVKPETEVEGLNIASDVTQVRELDSVVVID